MLVLHEIPEDNYCTPHWSGDFFWGSILKTSILYSGINNKELVENTAGTVLLLVAGTGMNAARSTITPGYIDKDGFSEFLEMDSWFWARGCFDDVLHSRYDASTIFLAAGNHYSCQSWYQCTTKYNLRFCRTYSSYSSEGERPVLHWLACMFFRFLSPSVHSIINVWSERMNMYVIFHKQKVIFSSGV